MCGPFTAGHGACPKCGLYTQGDSLEETNFFLARSCQLEIDSLLGIRACLYFSSQCWDPFWLGLEQALCQQHNFCHGEVVPIPEVKGGL